MSCTRVRVDRGGLRLWRLGGMSRKHCRGANAAFAPAEHEPSSHHTQERLHCTLRADANTRGAGTWPWPSLPHTRNARTSTRLRRLPMQRLTGVSPCPQAEGYTEALPAPAAVAAEVELELYKAHGRGVL